MTRLARIVLGAASPLLLLACLVGGGVGTWLFVLVSPLFPPALIVLGACREGGDRRPAFVALVLALSLELAALGVALSGGPPSGGPFVLGLPAATLWMLLGFGVLPLALVPWSYARLFSAGAARAAERHPDRRPGG